MSGIETDLTQFLLSKSIITDIVGTRIFPQHISNIDGAKFPAISYTRTGRTRVTTHSGHAGLSRPMIQIDCWAKTHDEVVDLGNRVVAVLDGFRGLMNGTRVDAVFFENDQFMYEPDTGVYHIPVEVQINHQS